MNATILQPTYLPWIGYFELIDAVDIFVIYDHVQFAKKSWQQRNRIKTSNGVVMLTVPIQREKREIKICDVKISYDHGNPLEKHWKTICLAYEKSEYFDEYQNIIKEAYSKKYVYLRDLNFELIKKFCEILGIKTKMIFSSEADNTEKKTGKTEDIISLCKKIGITFLYDAAGAQKFIDESLFDKENIQIKFQNYSHPAYRQLWGDFVPYMSIIDLLFNEGEKSLEIIRSGRKATQDFLR